MTNQVKIEIKTTELIRRNTQYGQTTKQPAWLHSDKPYPAEILIKLDEGQVAYREGMYTIEPRSFYVDKYKGLAVSPKLVPLAASK